MVGNDERKKSHLQALSALIEGGGMKTILEKAIDGAVELIKCLILISLIWLLIVFFCVGFGGLG